LLEPILLCSDCYNKNTINWVAYKHHTFIACISGGLEVE
jgi:hypothetical protein